MPSLSILTRKPRVGLSIVAMSALGVTASVAACSSSDDGMNCRGAKCDIGSDDFDRQILEDRNDPIAVYLRDQKISDSGLAELSYQDLLFGIAEQQGCGKDSVSVFTVSDELIASQGLFPRLVGVACGDDPAKASDFFIAASFMDRDTGDVDVRDVEMFAWDATAREYFFYAFAPSQNNPDQVQLEISPERCQECHLTPADTSPVGMRMTPIMNELRRPWTHWNAEPDFPSHGFELPSGIDEHPNFRELAIEHKTSASRLEEIIKFGGHEKVASARVRDRRNAPNVDEVMGMLRPLFCAEQLNYVSEDHDSGVIFNAALVDPGVRNMFIHIRPDNWPWTWLTDETIRLSPGGSDVTMIPTRGNSDAAMENALVTTNALTPYQVLRARALDWKNPAFSPFRCSLWKDARERLEQFPPDVGDATRNLHIMPQIFEEIMSFEGAPIHGGGDEVIVMLDEATPSKLEAFQAALADETLGASCSEGFCAGTVDDFGDLVDAHVSDILDSSNPRAAITELGAQRLCYILEEVEPVVDHGGISDPQVERFPNHPGLPPNSCSKGPLGSE